MPFGVVNRLSPRMRQVDGVEIALREGSIFGVNMGRPIITNGDFIAELRKSA